MKTYRVISEHMRLDRRYQKGEELQLTADQARYLVLNGKIAKVEGGQGEPAAKADKS